MIFTLRIVIFSVLILLAFHISLRSTPLRHLVTVIYLLTLFWYTFGCRMAITGVNVYGDDTLPAIPAPEPSLWEKIINLLKLIWGVQPDGTLAGGGVVKAMVMNGLLFVPLGYLLLLWIPVLRQKRSGWVAAVLITLAISISIELLQSITSLGMADWKDVIGNTLGGMIGIGMVRGYDRVHLTASTEK